jgi:hypothetical protein
MQQASAMWIKTTIPFSSVSILFGFSFCLWHMGVFDGYPVSAILLVFHFNKEE